MRLMWRVLVVSSVAMLVSVPVATAEPRIYGGHVASTKDHPWAVAIIFGDRDNGTLCGGGALVRKNKVVTSADCALDEKGALAPREMLKVVVRTDDLGSIREENRLEVSDVWLHPKYNRETAANDIAVLTLKDDIENAKTLSLADGFHDMKLYETGTAAKILGWGQPDDQPGSTITRKLHAAAVTLASDEECAAEWKLDANHQKKVVCAGGKRDGKSFCSGDSGSPLVVGRELVGVASMGEACHELSKPDVYTRIASYSEELGEELRK